MIGWEIRRTDSLIPTLLPFPAGATKRAHSGIMAQKAEIVQVMVGPFFVTRNPCKYWSKRLSGALLSSMFLGNCQKTGLFHHHAKKIKK
jgi:hypothetical protein